MQPQTKTESCLQKRTLIAEHMRLIRGIENAAKEYREVITVGTRGVVREAAHDRIEALKAEAKNTRAQYVDHRRAHGC
jgi:hypothetical protein